MLLSSCNSSTKEQTSENSKLIDEIKLSNEQDSSSPNYDEQDIVKPDPQIKTFDTDTKTKTNKLPEIPTPVRYIEFPSDANFNGKPMTQQEDILKKIFEKFPDTLSNLAIERYKTYNYYFPKAIADNFEEGVAREIVIYPKKLIFRFQLFENESASTPYITKDIIVRRNENGELYTE